MKKIIGLILVIVLIFMLFVACSPTDYLDGHYGVYVTDKVTHPDFADDLNLLELIPELGAGLEITEEGFAVFYGADVFFNEYSSCEFVENEDTVSWTCFNMDSNSQFLLVLNKDDENIAKLYDNKLDVYTDEIDPEGYVYYFIKQDV